MAKAVQSPPSDLRTLSQAIDAVGIYCGLVLASFAKHGRGLRDKICGNFIARGTSCAQNVFTVWSAGSERDAWVLHRTLVERLLHLHHLAETDSFVAFEEYTFVTLYEARHQLLSDPEMRDKVPRRLKELQRSDKARYEKLARKPRWRRPKAEDVAKQLNLGFLYRSGYDYPSRHIHPMANDGEADFARLTSPGRQVALPDATVVRNSLLVEGMLVQASITASNMRWSTTMYEFWQEFFLFLRTGDPRFYDALDKIVVVSRDNEICERKPTQGG
jgi:hypothetical protein